MSDTPRVSRSLAIFDLDHGILKESPASMLGPQYATAERVSRMAGPLLGPTLGSLSSLGSVRRYLES